MSLLGRAQPVIPPNLYSALMFMNIIAWGPQVNMSKLCSGILKVSYIRMYFLR